MPSPKKTLHFLCSMLACAGGVAILGYGMSVQWVMTNMTCSPTNTSNTKDGNASVTLGLFDAKLQLYLSLKALTGAALALHCLVISLLALALLGSAGSIFISLYNSISNPYETYFGPLGLYFCCSASASFLALIIFVTNVHVHNFAEDQVRENVGNVNLTMLKTNMQLGFFLILPYMLLHLLAVLMVYLYVHAAYTRQKEQQRPTEDAPKEIMMY
uniref:Clarin 3 n=1 Tax=Denticeps clupeoides TaxID=299321 RepID=A0AAY4BVH7_9TELE